MKSIMMMGLGLLVINECLNAEGAEPKKVASSQIELVEIEGIDEPEIYQHFYDVLTNGIEESETLTITDSGSERFLVFNTGDELQVHLLVADGEGGYTTALHFTTELGFALDGEEISLPTQVISFDTKALTQSMRVGMIQQSYEAGEPLPVIVTQQARVQSAEQRIKYGSGSTQAAKSIQVHCVAGGNAGNNSVCCGFSSGDRIRIICVCDKGNGQWVLCFDSNWA